MYRVQRRVLDARVLLRVAQPAFTNSVLMRTSNGHRVQRYAGACEPQHGQRR